MLQELELTGDFTLFIRKVRWYFNSLRLVLF